MRPIHFVANGVFPSIHINYKSSHLKQYFKENRAAMAAVCSQGSLALRDYSMQAVLAHEPGNPVLPVANAFSKQLGMDAQTAVALSVFIKDLFDLFE